MTRRKKRAGAQPGNTNALRHGGSSNRFKPDSPQGRLVHWIESTLTSAIPDPLTPGDTDLETSKREGHIQAFMWYSLAASDRTDEDRETAVTNRDSVAQKMYSEQMAEAQRLAREWKPKTGGQ